MSFPLMESPWMRFRPVYAAMTVCSVSRVSSRELLFLQSSLRLGFYTSNIQSLFHYWCISYQIRTSFFFFFNSNVFEHGCNFEISVNSNIFTIKFRALKLFDINIIIVIIVIIIIRFGVSNLVVSQRKLSLPLYDVC